MTQKSTSPTGSDDLSLSVVGPDNPTPLPPGTTHPTGGGESGDNDNDKPADKRARAENAAVAWSLIGIAACALVAGAAAAIWAWGWPAVALVVGVVVVIFVAAWWWHNSPAARRRRADRHAGGATPGRFRSWRAGGRPGSNRGGRPGSSRRGGRDAAGTGRRRGILGRLIPSRSGSSRRAASRNPGTSRGRKAGTPGRPGAARSGGTSRRGASQSGGSRSGSSRRPARRTPSPGRRRDTLMTSLSGSLLDAAREGWAEGWAKGYHGPERRPINGHDVEAAVKGAVDKIRKPKTTEPNRAGKGGNAASQGAQHMTSPFRSLFEQITEDLPQAAHRDDITAHDLGLEPLIQGFERGMPYIADYIKNSRERIEAENNAGTEGSVLEALETLEKAQRSNAALAAAALKVLRGSPTWQAMKERMEAPNGAKSDVSTARQMGY